MISEKWYRALGFGKAVSVDELVQPTAEDSERAQWLLGMLVHYPVGRRSSYDSDVAMLAKGLAASRDDIPKPATPRLKRERALKVHYLTGRAIRSPGQRTVCGLDGSLCPGYSINDGSPGEFDTANCDRFEATTYPDDVTCRRCLVTVRG